MKTLFVGLVCLCCALSSVIADDKQHSVYQIDALNHADQGLRYESVVQAWDPEPAIRKQILTLPTVTSQKIQYHSPTQVFLNQTIPFPQMVREAATDSKHRRLELRWQVSLPGLYRQLDQGKSHPLLYGGAMIYD
ncbi:hypothetical protein [uncultured Gimesia sp.]|uniref:hypothetical protein n=1 Tax=uncultured Gimesia sp. TaxID=1678688 RepID=UPI0030D8B2C5|tara:strand:- start:284909 stop:285313 length:405 start_codon:yes stop_codon:yes gene_type:complete